MRMVLAQVNGSKLWTGAKASVLSWNSSEFSPQMFGLDWKEVAVSLFVDQHTAAQISTLLRSWPDSNVQYSGSVSQGQLY